MSRRRMVAAIREDGPERSGPFFIFSVLASAVLASPLPGRGICRGYRRPVGFRPGWSLCGLGIALRRHRPTAGAGSPCSWSPGLDSGPRRRKSAHPARPGQAKPGTERGEGRGATFSWPPHSTSRRGRKNGPAQKNLTKLSFVRFICLQSSLFKTRVLLGKQ